MANKRMKERWKEGQQHLEVEFESFEVHAEELGVDDEEAWHVGGGDVEENVLEPVAWCGCCGRVWLMWPCVVDVAVCG